jgi:CDP-diacylglycerol--glycerol-3-phosphate 3-phosphatidyltransferase
VLYLEKIDHLDKLTYVVPAIIIILMVLSDLLDGVIARSIDGITNIGKVIDPVADKICLMVVIVFLTINNPILFLTFFLLLTVRDLIIISIGIYLIQFQEEVFQSNVSGKWFVGVTSLMLFSFVFNLHVYFQYSLYCISIVLMVISAGEYINRYFNYFKIIEDQYGIS